jgi:murein DD-endopeptidase MepM/ murein hydrolase activator NlpD
MLLSVDGVAPRPIEASGIGGVAAAIRQRQLRAEGTMRRADRQVRRLDRQSDAHVRALSEAKRRLQRSLTRRDRAREHIARAQDRLIIERAVRDRMLRVRPDPTGVQRADRPELRRRVHRLGDRVTRLERRAHRLTVRVANARQTKQARARRVGHARIEARERARERAESVLSEQIGLMLALAKERASLAASHSIRRFRRPVQGSISQGYGCQRSSGRAAGSRCLRFHDGIDIATARGARVRASAEGFVAYVGWNPWDHGRRAFVVIVGHADGFESVYAHLTPVRVVRAGQHVRRGQVIGVVGMTGHTSGPHVHWEVSRDLATVDPLGVGR